MLPIAFGPHQLYRALVQQVIVNLVLNAQDAMDGGGRITLRTENVRGEETDPPSRVRLSVADTGAGMTSYVRQRLFEPFFTTKGERGTGLGLAMVYGIVKQSGGSIGVQSAPGAGTRFTIELPVVDAQPTDEAPVSPSSASRASLLPAGGHETILLVEDEAMLRRLLTACLEQAGYRVLSAGDATEALALVARHHEPLHLVVSDVMLGETRGPDLVRQLTSAQPNLAALLMSGYVSGEHGGLPADVPFLAKPFDTVELLERVREVLDGARSTRPRPLASEAYS